MQWGERTQIRRIKSGLTNQELPSQRDGFCHGLMEHPHCWGGMKVPQGGTPQGGVSPMWAAVGCRVFSRLEHLSLPRRDM